MACGRNAEGKFWSSPELVERLLVGFLEPRAIVNLAQVHILAFQTLQKPIVWKKVTDKAVDPRKDGWEKEDGTWKTEDGRGEAEFFNFHQDKMDHLAYIVDLVNSDEIKMHLVEVICERFLAEVDNNTGAAVVQMTFSCPHRNHAVSDLGFILLEVLELGKVEEVNAYVEEEFLLALSRRVSSQQGLVNLLFAHTVQVETAEGAEAFSSLAKRCKKLEVGFLKVAGDIGRQGWAALGETMDKWGGKMSTLKIRLGEGEAQTESLKALMETAHVWGRNGCSMTLDPDEEEEDPELIPEEEDEEEEVEEDEEEEEEVE